MERLHIGGKKVKPGWKIFNIQPGEHVDFVGDVQDLSEFGDESWDEIYASHVLEHLPHASIVPTLKGMHRVLKRGGKAMISVPDLEVLCRLYIDPQLVRENRFHVMTMMFGGQVDEFDFHYAGISFEFMSEYLATAGFSKIERVKAFGLFDDASNFAPYGDVPISLNVIAYRDR